MYDTLAIGIDQSYERCGFSVAADGHLLTVTSRDLSQFKTKTEKRAWIRQSVLTWAAKSVESASEVICVIERIRTFSQTFISAPYMTAMGAMNAVIVDACASYQIPVYSVNTKSWKSAVVGTSKPAENDYGVPPEKWPTVRWLISEYPQFEKRITHRVTGRRTKGTFVDRDGVRWEYDNDAADSAGIAMFPFKSDRAYELLKKET